MGRFGRVGGWMRSFKNEFSLLSLNTFGLPFFLGWWRLARLASKLGNSGATIICLQEIQQNAYAPLMARCLNTYPHRAVYPHIFAPKGGLGIYSRLPLARRRFEVYKDRGLRWLVTFSDWALYKGALIADMKFQDLEIVLLNTHLNANYTGVWHRKNPLALTQHRQVQQLTRMVEELPADAFVIVCGDLNFPRDTFLYKELISQNRLSDPLSNDPRPTYRPFPLVPPRWNTSLDYILFRAPHKAEYQVQADIVIVEDTTKKRAFQRFLTDHCALTLQISW
jgi:endonuclease/exonuclease/phosphatase family metal-dependent hydrolase